MNHHLFPATSPLRRSFFSSSKVLCTISRPRMSQPAWAQPTGSTHQPQLKVYNSLTKSKVPFVPLVPETISWYSCGPTVYDDAHLGHARNYVTTDIIRRILRDYFGFKVRFVMNITDVDDKIILRGRQRHLYEEYKTKHRSVRTRITSSQPIPLTLFIGTLMTKCARMFDKPGSTTSRKT